MKKLLLPVLLVGCLLCPAFSSNFDLEKNRIEIEASVSIENDINSIMNEIWPVIESYKEERLEFENSSDFQKNGWNSTWKNQNASDYWDKKNEEINRLLQNAGYGSVRGSSIKTLNRTTVENRIKTNVKQQKLEEIKIKKANQILKEKKIEDLTLEETEYVLWLLG